MVYNSYYICSLSSSSFLNYETADWKARLRCFQYVSKWVDGSEQDAGMALSSPSSSSSFSDTTSLKCERIVKSIVTSIPDAHHKVTHVALETLGKILSLQKIASFNSTTDGTTEVTSCIFASALPTLLAHIFQTLVDVRSNLRKESNVVLSHILDRHPTNDIVSMLVTLLDHSSQKTRLGCLEFLLHLVPMSGRTLSRTSMMRQAVHKTCENVQSSNASVKRAAENVLVSLHQLNPALVLTQLNTIHTHLREKIVISMQGKIPRLKQTLSTAARSSTVRRSPPPAPSSHMNTFNATNATNAANAANTSISSFPPPSTPNGRGTTITSTHQSRSSTSSTHHHHHTGASSRSARRKKSPRTDSNNVTSSSSRRINPQAIFTMHNVGDILTALASSTSPPSIARGLIQVSRLARDMTDSEEWACVFPQLIIAVVSTLRAPDSSTRVHGLMAVRTMLETHPVPFNGLTDVVLKTTLEACRDDVQDVLTSAGTTLRLMAAKLNCTSCAKSLLFIMQSCNNKQGEKCVMRMCLRAMSAFVPRMSSATVYGALDDLMPPVMRCMNDSESSIRKESVFLFVKIYNSVGDAHARPYMDQLSVAQQKLVTIYIQRSSVVKGV